MYRLKSIVLSMSAVWAFVTKDRTEVLVFVMGCAIAFGDASLWFRLCGLEPDFVYALTFYGQNEKALPPVPERCSVRGLMAVGISAPIVDDFDSRILNYRKVKSEYGNPEK